MLILHKDKLHCPECQTKMVEAVSISGAESDFYMSCPNCPTYVDTYIPLDHQAAFHADPARYSAMFSGYGTGKTLADVKDDEKHILITPKGETLVGATVLNQVESTFKKDFERDFPLAFLKHYNKQKNEMFFVNDHKLMYRPLYDQGVLRSLNLTRFTIVEASEVDYDKFTQLQTRLRNRAGMIPWTDHLGNILYDIVEGRPRVRIKYDWRKGTLESNPDAGWIKDEFLGTSNRIYLHGKEIHEQQYLVPTHKADIHKSTHIVPTAANPHLPPDFISEISAGKPRWWIKRYLEGSFEYAEGLVYPEALRTIVDSFDIPKHWQHVIASDYGINDETVFLFGAIDPVNYILYIYHELVVNRMNVREISNLYKADLKRFVPLGGLMTSPVMDRMSLTKPQSSDVEKTLGDLFLEEGLLFKPAKMNLNARILRTNTFIELGQIKIFKNCRFLIGEIIKYKFPEKTLDGKGKNTDKPEDKNNHAVNTLEFMAMELPPNLKQLDFSGVHASGKVIQAYMGERRERTSEMYNPFYETNQEEETSNPFYNSLY